MKEPKVIIVMPAYHASKTLEKTFRDIPEGSFDEIILVDDASRDQEETIALAKKLGMTTIRHHTNTGYGGNQKTCYREALERGADIVVMLHPDYQYDARVVPHLVGFIKKDICDVVFGNRIRTRKEALARGMPVYKYISNRFLTVLNGVVLGQHLGETSSGLRAYSRQVLETIPYELNSNNFAFDGEFIVQASYFGFRLGDIPVPVRYFSDSSNCRFWQGIPYGIGILKVLLKYILHTIGIFHFKIFKNKNQSELWPTSPPLKRYILFCLDKIIQQHNLQPPFLDVGCGIGDVSQHLAQQDWSGKAIDFSDMAVIRARDRLSKFKNIEVEQKLISQETGKYKTILLLDVLEHIQDDDLVLKQIYELLDTQGSLIISVPVNPDEWRWDDDFYGHFRRYKLPELSDKLKQANLQIISIWDFTYPVFWLIRRIYTKLKYFAQSIQENKSTRTKKSSLNNAWEIPLISNLISRPLFFWKLIYKIQFKYFKDKPHKGCESIILVKKF